jgi:hypothetical protein
LSEYQELKKFIAHPALVKDLTEPQANILLAEAQYVRAQCEETLKMLQHGINALRQRLEHLKNGGPQA